MPKALAILRIQNLVVVIESEGMESDRIMKVKIGFTRKEAQIWVNSYRALGENCHEARIAGSE